MRSRAAVTASVTVSFEVLAEQSDSSLHIELIGDLGIERATLHPAPHQWCYEEIEFTPSSRLRYVTFRTKPPRSIGGPAVSSSHPIPPNTDHPQPSVAFRIRNLLIT